MSCDYCDKNNTPRDLRGGGRYNSEQRKMLHTYRTF